MSQTCGSVFRLLLLFVAIGTTSCGLAATIDKSQASDTTDSGILWYDAQLLGVQGQGWREVKAPYDRLPAKAEGVVRPEVWELSRNPSGLCVRFVTDAREVHVRWTLQSGELASPRMPATGFSGLDLYAKQADGNWRWAAAARPSGQDNTVKILADLSAERREFLLYLPLYNGVEALAIGLPPDAVLERAGAWGEGNRKPIVFYGTSITQGACASRPGMAATAIVGRRLNFPVINLGFSGNGRLETELADLLVELDPSVFVIDCLPNMSAEQTAARAEPFVLKLRDRHPETPILLVEECEWPNVNLISSRRAGNAANWQALRAAHERLLQAGVKNLHYLKGDLLLPPDGDGTVDGVHPTDYGFLHQAGAFEKVLRPILFPQ